MSLLRNARELAGELVHGLLRVLDRAVERAEDRWLKKG